MALIDEFWGRVHEAIEASPDGRKGMQRALESVSPRNKNTYTRWLSPKQSASRPDIRLSDVEDIAAALRISSAALLFGGGRGAPTNRSATYERHEQLEFLFEQESKTITLQLECTGAGVIVRPGKD